MARGRAYFRGWHRQPIATFGLGAAADRRSFSLPLVRGQLLRLANAYGDSASVYGGNCHVVPLTRHWRLGRGSGTDLLGLKPSTIFEPVDEPAAS